MDESCLLAVCNTAERCLLVKTLYSRSNQQVRSVPPILHLQLFETVAAGCKAEACVFFKLVRSVPIRHQICVSSGLILPSTDLPFCSSLVLLVQIRSVQNVRTQV